MKLLKEFLTLGICLYYFPTVEAIKCFQCSSVDPDCLDLGVNNTNSKYYKECTGNYYDEQPFCRKTFQTLLDTQYVRVTRECGWVFHKTRTDNCYLNDDDFKLEKSCQCFSDGCNSSTTVKQSYFILLITFIFTYLQIF